MIRTLLKPLSFLPVIFMMYVIFGFSSQDGATSSQLSYKVSHKIVEVGSQIIGADLQPEEIDALATRFHGPLRKIAHMTEYFVLAITVAFPLYVYGLRGILLMLVAGFLCVAFACGDEYHQSYVDGRGPSKRDVLIDSFGVFWGIILVRIIGWTGRKTIFRPLSRKKRKYQENPAPAPYSAYGPETPSVYPPGSAPYQPYSAPNAAQYYGPSAQQAQSPGAPGYYGPSARQNQSPGAAQYYGPSAQQTQSPGAPAYYDPHGRASAWSYDSYPEDTTSDRLSEDMSLRKLVHDLKDQKKEQHTRKKAERKPRLEENEAPFENDEP